MENRKYDLEERLAKFGEGIGFFLDQLEIRSIRNLKM